MDPPAQPRSGAGCKAGSMGLLLPEHMYKNEIKAEIQSEKTDIPTLIEYDLP